MLKIRHLSFYFLPQIGLNFIPDINEFKLPLVTVALVDFEFINGINEWGKFLETIISRVEIGLFLLKQTANIAQKCPAIVVGQIGNSGRN